MKKGLFAFAILAAPGLAPACGSLNEAFWRLEMAAAAPPPVVWAQALSPARVDDSEMARPQAFFHRLPEGCPPAAPTAPAPAGTYRTLPAPVRTSPPSLEEELSASVFNVFPSFTAWPAGLSGVQFSIAERTDLHLKHPIGLPLGKGPETHVAVYFGGDGKVKVAFTREDRVRLYSVAELEAGSTYEVGDTRFALRLRSAARPWASVLIVSPEKGGEPYLIELYTLYFNAVMEGFEVRKGEERIGSVLVYRDPYAVREQTFLAYLPTGGIRAPTAYVLDLETVPEDGTARFISFSGMTGSPIAFRRAEGALFVYAP